MVRHGFRRPDNQSLGLGVWPAQADIDGTHRAGDRPRRERPPPLHVFLRAGQDGQVLGPGVQQGHPALPRPPQRRVLPGPPPYAGHPAHGGKGCLLQGLGHEDEGSDPLPDGPRQHGVFDPDPRHRPAGHHGIPRQHCEALGPGCGEAPDDADSPQEGRAGDGHASQGVHFLLGIIRQHQEVQAPGWCLHAQHAPAPEEHH
mmetsp:Transcript_8387/g.21617  ORF Transcript_8387/g.21617 Transcript_8387/m.21617 type:complete len:201 (-) Transcript_8387:440-1042(-)